LAKPEEKIAVYEHNLYGVNKGETIHDEYGNYFYKGQSFYSLGGDFLLKQKYYCAKNISAHVEEISQITGVFYYKGNGRIQKLFIKK